MSSELYLELKNVDKSFQSNYEKARKELFFQVLKTWFGFGKKLDNDTVVLENINIKIHKGDKYLILGDKESGKTVLSKILGRILAPDVGERVAYKEPIYLVGKSSRLAQDLITLKGYVEYLVIFNGNKKKNIEVVISELKQRIADLDVLLNQKILDIDVGVLKNITVQVLLELNQEFYIIDGFSQDILKLNDSLKNKTYIFFSSDYSIDFTFFNAYGFLDGKTLKTFDTYEQFLNFLENKFSYEVLKRKMKRFVAPFSEGHADSGASSNKEIQKETKAPKQPKELKLAKPEIIEPFEISEPEIVLFNDEVSLSKVKFKAHDPIENTDKQYLKNYVPYFEFKFLFTKKYFNKKTFVLLTIKNDEGKKIELDSRSELTSIVPDAHKALSFVLKIKDRELVRSNMRFLLDIFVDNKLLSTYSFNTINKHVVDLDKFLNFPSIYKKDFHWHSFTK